MKINKIKIIIFVLVLLPIVASAQVFKGIPCNGPDCDFNALMKLVENVIDFLGLIALPLAVISIAIAGGKIMIAGSNVGERTAGIKMMWTVVQGFGVLLAAWLIVKTVLTVLLDPSYLDSLPLNLNP